MTDHELMEMLSDMTVEQIEEVQRRYEEEMPISHKMRVLFMLVLNEKRSKRQDEEVILKIIQDVKNAPDGATNTEQGE